MGPWFFEHLGIAPTRDVAAIKKAYASALKRIDTLRQRVAFEHLRRAHDQALTWARQPVAGTGAERRVRDSHAAVAALHQ